MANKGFSSGKIWTVKICKSDKVYIFVGVATSQIKCDQFVGNDQFGLGYFLNDRCRYHNRSKISNEKIGPSSFKTGDEITLTLDFDEQELELL